MSTNELPPEMVLEPGPEFMKAKETRRIADALERIADALEAIQKDDSQ